MSIQVKEYEAEDWDRAEYLIERGFIQGGKTHEDIEEAAKNIYIVRMRGWDQYIKNGGKPPFENK